MTNAERLILGLLAVAIAVVYLAGCVRTTTMGCRVSAGLHNEVGCSIDVASEPTPAP